MYQIQFEEFQSGVQFNLILIERLNNKTDFIGKGN